MNSNKLFLSFLCLLLLSFTVASSKDFDDAYLRKHLSTSIYQIDSGASAVVLYENTLKEIYFQDGSIRTKQTIHKLIKILKREAIGDAKTTIYYSALEQLQPEKSKACTYNLVDDKVIRNAVSRQDLIKSAGDKKENSFTILLPNVKVGSVIEYSYETDRKGIATIHSWLPQEQYPKLECIFSINCPLNMSFTTITNIGLRESVYKTEEEAVAGTDSFAFVSRAYEYTKRAFWIRRNVDPQIDEQLVYNVLNLSERIELQLTEANIGGHVSNFNNSWKNINDFYWEKANFKNMLYNPNSILDKVLDSLVRPDMIAKDRVAAIYKYVRNKYNNNNHGGQPTSTNIDKLLTSTSLSTSEINLILAAALTHAKMPAELIVLGTANLVSPSEMFPVLDRMNYMVCRVKVDEDYLYLDASNKYNVLGLLPVYCYNGFSWVFGDTGKNIQLTPDLIKNKNIYNFKISDFTDSTAKLEITKKLGLINSSNYRRSWNNDPKQKIRDLENLKYRIPSYITIINSQSENDNAPDTNLIIRQSCIIHFKKNEPILLNTNLITLYDSNPFKAPSRKAPIEFSYKNEYAFYTNISLPPDIVPDTLSEPMSLQYRNGSLSYKKAITYIPDMHMLTINSDFSINNTYFGQDEFLSLKEFFQKMIYDANEMIELNKIKK